MRVAENVSALELGEYQHAARQVLRHPLITAVYPDKTTLPLVRKWAPQLREDLSETLGYTLVVNGDTVRLRRIQDTLDPTRPAYTRAKKPFDRRRYAYLVLTMSALGRSGSQIALSELAGAVAAVGGGRVRARFRLWPSLARSSRISHRPMSVQPRPIRSAARSSTSSM